MPAILCPIPGLRQQIRMATSERFFLDMALTEAVFKLELEG